MRHTMAATHTLLRLAHPQRLTAHTIDGRCCGAPTSHVQSQSRRGDSTQTPRQQDSQSPASRVQIRSKQSKQSCSETASPPGARNGVLSHICIETPVPLCRSGPVSAERCQHGNVWGSCA